MCAVLNIGASACGHCCRVKPVNITCSECVCVVLVIQHAIRMSHIGICGLSDYIQYFSTLSNKRHDFRKKKLYRK
jgi:hypothetical protein